MSDPLPTYALKDIRPLLQRGEVIAAVREAVIRHSAGEVQSPMPGQLTFPEVNGDCHIKYGHIRGADQFVVKIATGFYDNPQSGQPVNNGLMLLFDSRTGAPRCLFQDEGWMTAWRTAAAVALAAHCLAPRPAPHVGIIGTGQQAQLATQWVPEVLPGATFMLLGRDASRTRETADRCGARVAPSMASLLSNSDIVITTTPAAHALFAAEDAHPGQHFVAVGADGPEKQELPPQLFGRASVILTDDHAQCLALSDFGRAVRTGVIAADTDRALGDVLGARFALERKPAEITIADLTGLAAQDIAIANLLFGKLQEQAHR